VRRAVGHDQRQRAEDVAPAGEVGQGSYSKS
jgi:hypothetical protein